MKIIKNLSPSVISQIITHLRTIPMKEDKSNYARNRKIQWIGVEPQLFATQDTLKTAKKAYQDARITKFCELIMPFKVDFILLTYSGDQASGINWHRDASYAKALAGTINLGKCSFGMRERSGTYSPDSEEKEQWITLTGGEVVTFDCKHPHCAIPDPNRRAIHCWSSSGK
jgi:hypothetical protein